LRERCGISPRTPVSVVPRDASSRPATRSRGCCTSPSRARSRRGARGNGGSRHPCARRVPRSHAATRS